MKFYVPVTEVVTIDCTYVVEADSVEEAICLAQIGDTLDEERDTSGSVIERVVDPDPEYIQSEEDCHDQA